MIRGVVLVAIRKHQSYISRELLGVVILSAVHLPLKTITEMKRFQPNTVFAKNKVNVCFIGVLELIRNLTTLIHQKNYL